MLRQATQLRAAIETVPPGAWAVGVSGGADSVALLTLLRTRTDLQLHVIHLNHETRGRESDRDAAFVKKLCDAWNIPSTIARRSEIEPQIPLLPNNPSSRYRVLRLELFAGVVKERNLQGVILAHHANDVAETTMQRLLRGSAFAGLGALRRDNIVQGVRLLRPLLDVRADELKTVLRSASQEWREDASNESNEYLRNRLRKILAHHPNTTERMLELGRACDALQQWTRDVAPVLDERFAISHLADLPLILAREAGRRWLLERGVDSGGVTGNVVGRLIEMATDAASSGKREFPGGIGVRRKTGEVFVESSQHIQSAPDKAGG